MAGDNPKSSSNHHNPNANPKLNSPERKSRWGSTATSTATATATITNPSSSSNKPSTDSEHPTTATTTTRASADKFTTKRGPDPNPNPPPPPRPPLLHPTYGFHMLDRRTIVLADGTVRNYYALPPDYQELPPPRFGPPPDWLNRPAPVPNSLSMKRKSGLEDERDRDMDEFSRQKLLRYGNAGAYSGSGTSSPAAFKKDDEYQVNKYMRVGAEGGVNNAGFRVDPEVMKAFLRFVKLMYENYSQRKSYFENGSHGSLQCLACPRSSKDFPDMHALIMHAYYSDNADLRVDHLGFHKALCVVMGWNSLRAPDTSRAYQYLPTEEVAAIQDDLIMWPPMVIINNTNTGKGKDGRMEGLGNKAMDSKLRDLGFSGGKSKSIYSRDGHLGITLIKFASDQSGLKEAMRLAEHFEKEHHGRRDWAHIKSTASGRDDESNPNLVLVDPMTGEKRRILYGYLATAFDLDKVDYDTRKKVVIESKREKLQPS